MIYKLTGTLQNYVWGGNQYIPELLDLPVEENQYYAEWWLGAHNSAPSIIEVNGEKEPLTEFLQQNPTAVGVQSREVLVMNYLIY